MMLSPSVFPPPKPTTNTQMKNMETQYFSNALPSFLILHLLIINTACISVDFIRTSCSSTIYPTLCYSSLSTHAAAIQQNPKLLATTALAITLDAAVSTSTAMLKLSCTAGMNPREASAVRDCVEVLVDSVDQLRKSMAEMKKKKGSDLEVVMSNTQTWVSAALTDEDTCIDGFAGKFTNGGVKTVVRGEVVNLAHMTSNALSLINTYASLHA